jgi:DNA topoisomerase-1
MGHTLFVIEAPGKVETMKKLLADIRGLGDFRIVATRGHFLSMPPGLDPLNIDENLNEEGREPNQFVVDRLLEESAGAKEIVLATDADAEGEVIARDAGVVLQGRADIISRMRFRAVALDALVEAYEDRTVWQPATAYAGDTRRILDRLMGAALSNSKTGVYTGRVQSALLSSISKVTPPAGEVIIELPAADGGRPFMAKLPFRADQREQVEQLAEKVKKLAPASVGESKQEVREKPWSFGQAIVRAHVATGMPVKQVSQIFQTLYENGKMTYPRSSATAVHESTVSTLEKLAKRHKVRFNRQQLPTIKGNGVDGVSVSHPSPAPLVEVAVDSPLRSMPPEERVLAVLTRNLIASGTEQLVERPDLSGHPEWAQKMEFSRVDRALPWERNVKAKVIDYDPEATIMLALMQAGVGRPSTLVSHAEKFMGRGLVDQEFNLTEKGQKWLNSLPSAIGRISPAMLESAFDLLSGAPEERVRTIVAMMGDAGVEIARRFEEMTGKQFPQLPDPAEMQIKQHKLNEESKLRREIEAGRAEPEKLIKPEFRAAPIRMKVEALR